MENSDSFYDIENDFMYSLNNNILYKNGTYNMSDDYDWTLDLLQSDEDLTFVAVLTLIYCVLFLVALIGDLVLIYSVKTSRKQSKLDFFLINFAVTDILMICSWMFFTVFGNIVFQFWPFEEIMCRVLRYSQNVLVLQRSFSMIIFSHEQHYVISNPIEAITRKPYCVKYSTIFSWSLASLLTIPSFANSQVQEIPIGPDSPALCVELWEDGNKKLAYDICIILLQYIIPLIVIACFYFHIGFIIWTNKIPGEQDLRRDNRISKSKLKSVKMLISLVVCFGITWMPLYVLRVIGEVYPQIYDSPIIHRLWFVFQLVAFSDSALNSLINFSLNDSFLKTFLKLVASVICRKVETRNRKKVDGSTSLESQEKLTSSL